MQLHAELNDIHQTLTGIELPLIFGNVEFFSYLLQVSPVLRCRSLNRINFTS